MLKIPEHWFPKAKPSRIIVHWTGGGPKASSDDLQYYHFVIEQDKEIALGKHSIADNDKTWDGTYAAHTRRLNTGSIGIALAGMYDAVERPFQPGPYPINPLQWDTAVNFIAELCKRYKITLEYVVTHAEVPRVFGTPQKGKWDITVDPKNLEAGVQGAKIIGDILRRDINLALMDNNITAKEEKENNIKKVQKWLKVEDDGIYGPITQAALVKAIEEGRLNPCTVLKMG